MPITKKMKALVLVPIRSESKEVICLSNLITEAMRLDTWIKEDIARTVESTKQTSTTAIRPVHSRLFANNFSKNVTIKRMAPVFRVVRCLIES